MTRVAIYADSAAHARQLATLLAEDERLEIVETRAALRFFAPSALADVVLAAHIRPEDLSREGPPVVLLSAEQPRFPPFPAPVHAWLPEDTLPAEISAALIAAAQDLTVLTPGQARRWSKNEPGDQPPPFVEALTPRELQVLRMMADGLGNKQIATRLAISDHTAKFHVAQILAKLRASSRAEAVAVGIRRGLVPI